MAVNKHTVLCAPVWKRIANQGLHPVQYIIFVEGMVPDGYSSTSHWHVNPYYMSKATPHSQQPTINLKNSRHTFLPSWPNSAACLSVTRPVERQLSGSIFSHQWATGRHRIQNPFIHWKHCTRAKCLHWKHCKMAKCLQVNVSCCSTVLHSATWKVSAGPAVTALPSNPCLTTATGGCVDSAYVVFAQVAFSISTLSSAACNNCSRQQHSQFVRLAMTA